MKKISLEQYNELKPAQREILKTLGIEVEEEYRPERIPKSRDAILQSYAMVVETDCKLCKSTTIKVFSMEGIGGLLVSHERSIDQVEGMTIKTRTETVLTCSMCHDVLKLMNTEDLIALTLKAAKGECRCSVRK